MLFPHIGPIELNELRAFLVNEVGDNTALFSPISLNSPTARYTSGKHSGVISLGDFRDKIACEIRSPALPISPAAMYQESLSNVGSNGGISVSLTRAGRLTIQSHLYTGTPVVEYISNMRLSGVYGADVIQKNCSVTITRNSWNGVGDCTGSYTYTPALGWDTAGFSLSFLGTATAEATYTMSVQDLLNPANNISFTTTLRLTP